MACRCKNLSHHKPGRLSVLGLSLELDNSPSLSPIYRGVTLQRAPIGALAHLNQNDSLEYPPKEAATPMPSGGDSADMQMP